MDVVIFVVNMSIQMLFDNYFDCVFIVNLDMSYRFKTLNYQMHRYSYLFNGCCHPCNFESLNLMLFNFILM